MSSKDLRPTIIRILNDEELSGYSIYKTLLMKGIKSWPNHIYTLLVEMENENHLLKSRWVEEKKRRKNNRNGAPRKHLYSLSESGRDEYENIVRDSLGVLMERFYKENLSFEDINFHIELVNETLGETARWSRKDKFKLVISSPSYHPLVCFPKFYYAVSEAYPNSSIYVVKSPWNSVRPLEGAANLTFLDGSRNEIPLKDDFADYVLLQGFPNSSSVIATINESLRVLKDDGCLFVEIPAVMTVEKRLPYNTVFPEYVLKLFYELCGQDRTVRLEDIRGILSGYFEHVKDLERRGRVIFYALGKKTKKAATTGIHESQVLRARNLISG